jgi:hypothetical protein
MRVPITIAVLLLLLCILCGFLVAIPTTGISESKKKVDSDTTRFEKGKFPFEAAEISISEDRIYIRTKEGKEYLVGPEGKIRIPTKDGDKYYILRGEEPVEEIILDEGRIKIGDVEIDLRDLEDLEALEGLEGLEALEALEALEDVPPIVIPRVKIPRVEVMPRVYTSEGIFKMGKDIVVEEDEEIDGDVVAMGGSIEVKGIVNGSAVAIGGDVDVFPTGVVEEDAVSVGGQVVKRGEAIVRGEKVSIGFLRTPPFKMPFGTMRFPMFHPFGFPAWAFVARILKILFFIFLGIVVLAILPKNVDKIKDRVKHEFVKSGLVGLAAEILVLPIFILLIITIIGIPVALLVEPILIIVALILGYVGTCLFVGEKLGEQTSLKPDTKIMMLVVGILAVELVPLVARTIGFFGDVFSPFAWIITIIGWMIGYVVITVGFGAAILTRLGTRPKNLKPVSVPSDKVGIDSEKKSSG